MKNWKRTVTGILAVSVLTAGQPIRQKRPKRNSKTAPSSRFPSLKRHDWRPGKKLYPNTISPAVKSWLKLFHCWKDWLLPKPVWTPESTIFTVWTKR